MWMQQVGTRYSKCSTHVNQHLSFIKWTSQGQDCCSSILEFCGLWNTNVAEIPLHKPCVLQRLQVPKQFQARRLRSDFLRWPTVYKHSCVGSVSNDSAFGIWMYKILNSMLWVHMANSPEACEARWEIVKSHRWCCLPKLTKKYHQVYPLPLS